MIKFDIEGAEWDVFSHTSVDKVASIIGEYHEDLAGFSVEQFIDLFPGFESKITRLANQIKDIWFR